MASGRATFEDPLRAFRFLVEIDGFERAGFTECSGLVSTTEVIKYREGSDPTHPKSLPGITDFDPITLKRGLILSDKNDIEEWYNEVYAARRDKRAANFRRSLDVVIQTEDGSGEVRYRVLNAWPSKFTASPTMGGQTNEAYIQEVELTHEGFYRVR